MSGDTFVITPYGADRKYLQPEDMVTIKGDKKEAGKTPSRSVGLHQKIYELHPEINAVLMSQPYSIMAFAVTGADFDSRTIPESYIMLRDIPRISVTRLYEEPDAIARALSESAQVVMVENNCIVTCGESLLKAFDRLEVADFSAQSIIEAQKLGGVVKINEAQVEEINEAFGLK